MSLTVRAGIALAIAIVEPSAGVQSRGTPRTRTVSGWLARFVLVAESSMTAEPAAGITRATRPNAKRLYQPHSSRNAEKKGPHATRNSQSSHVSAFGEAMLSAVRSEERRVGKE